MPNVAPALAAAQQDPDIVVCDFDTARIGLTLPSSRLRSYNVRNAAQSSTSPQKIYGHQADKRCYQDLVVRAHMALYKSRDAYDSHIHLSNTNCGHQISQRAWESGMYFTGDRLEIFMHFKQKDESQTTVTKPAKIPLPRTYRRLSTYSGDGEELLQQEESGDEDEVVYLGERAIRGRREEQRVRQRQEREESVIFVEARKQDSTGFRTAEEGIRARQEIRQSQAPEVCLYSIY